jgi:hypothetical protein
LDYSGEEGLGCSPRDTKGLGVGTFKRTALVFGGGAVIRRSLEGTLIGQRMYIKDLLEDILSC